MKLKITLISDTHTKHAQITQDLLSGGDLIIHAGDVSSMGYQRELKDFFEWYSTLPYAHKVFIAGNHDWGFETDPTETALLLKNYPDITYLQDDMYVLGDDYQTAVKIWGSPWQPRFHNWAFNADRGEDIKYHWDKIPNDIDILVTHGPAFGYMDVIYGQTEHLGCEELTKAISRVKPKIHVCGHIHSASGYGRFPHAQNKLTHVYNASMLNERYQYWYLPYKFEWDSETNERTILNYL